MTADVPQPASGTDVSEAVRAARVDIEEGRLWRARDRLWRRVGEHADREALDLLGQVLHDMGDLPAAGAVWFGTRRRGDDVDAAVSAWREKFGDDFAAMWRSIPRSVRLHPGPRRLEALRHRARRVDDEARTHDATRAALRDTEHEVLSRPPLDGSAQQTDGTAGKPDEEEGGGFDAATLIAWILAAAFVGCAVVGLVTVLRWIVPS